MKDFKVALILGLVDKLSGPLRSGPLKQLEALQRQADITDRAMNRIGQGGAIIAGAAAIAAPFIYGFNAASNLTEAVSKNQIVFGQHGRAIESWAGNAREALGMTRLEALDATGAFGNLFTSMGVNRGKAAGLSMDVTQLASDLSSFNNIPMGDALTKLRAGLVGEYEPLRSLGTYLSATLVAKKAFDLGMVKTPMPFERLPSSVKMLASYQLILEQTKNAQGDFARTANSSVNALRSIRSGFGDLAETIGGQLEPVFNPLIVGFRDVLFRANRFAEANPMLARALALSTVGTAALMTVVGLGIVTFAGFTLAVSQSRIGLLMLARSAPQAAAGQTLLNRALIGGRVRLLQAAGAARVFALSLLTNPVFLFIAAVTGIGIAFTTAWRKSEQFRAGVLSALEPIRVAWGGLKTEIASLGGVFSPLGNSSQNFAKRMGADVAHVHTPLNALAWSLGYFFGYVTTKGAQVFAPFAANALTSIGGAVVVVAGLTTVVRSFFDRSVTASDGFNTALGGVQRILGVATGSAWGWVGALAGVGLSYRILNGLTLGLMGRLIALGWTFGTFLAGQLSALLTGPALGFGSWLVLTGRQALTAVGRLATLAWAMGGLLLSQTRAFLVGPAARFGAWLLLISRQAIVTGARVAAGWLLALGPVGWIIGGVLALGAAFVFAWQRSERFRDVVMGALGWAGSTAIWLWDVVSGGATEAWNWAGGRVQAFKNYAGGQLEAFRIMADTAWAQVKTAGVNSWQALRAKVGAVWGFIKGIPEGITTGFSGVWDDFKTQTQQVFDSILGYIQPVIDKVTGFFNKVKNFRLPSIFGGGAKGGATDAAADFGRKAKPVYVPPNPVAAVTPPVALPLPNPVATFAPPIANRVSTPDALRPPVPFESFDPAKVLPLVNLDPARGYGRLLAQGFAGGILSEQEVVQYAAVRMGKAAESALRRQLGIQSPSRVFAALGRFIPQGLEQGIKQLGGRAVGAVRAMAAAATVAGAVSLPAIAAPAVPSLPTVEQRLTYRRIVPPTPALSRLEQHIGFRSDRPPTPNLPALEQVVRGRYVAPQIPAPLEVLSRVTQTAPRISAPPELGLPEPFSIPELPPLRRREAEAEERPAKRTRRGTGQGAGGEGGRVFHIHGPNLHFDMSKLQGKRAVLESFADALEAFGYEVDDDD